MALRGDGTHFVSNMKTKYKETARGGLAVNIMSDRALRLGHIKPKH
jgi:hypothetical protein